jgi:transposase
LLASAKGTKPKQIATAVGCSVQTVRNTIHAFEQQGVACIEAESSRPKTPKPIFDATKRERLRQLLHAHPRLFGKSRSTWILDLLAEVCCEQGITPKPAIASKSEEAQSLDVTQDVMKNLTDMVSHQSQLESGSYEQLMQLRQPSATANLIGANISEALDEGNRLNPNGCMLNEPLLNPTEN